MQEFHKALEALTPQKMLGMRRGLEKESLRVQPQGALATTGHPVALGSALTHPHITTDFCESQVELITGVHASTDACFHELVQVQQFTSKAIGSERLWVSSMPCGLPADDAIPIGQYGSSNVGMAKSVYRTGLGYRYGRRMQTISGIHYNWSLPDVSSEQYFSLIRNFRRQAFLLLYLFGASPAVCSSFVAGRQHQLEQLSEFTLYRPYATSLRMGRLGYQSDAQASLAVSYNSLQGYGDSLHDALTRPYPSYEAIGVRGPDGQYRQLATTLLQIENEFYGTIRPKRVIFPGERPLHALRERGVEYVEVRLMDLDPFEKVGINAQTMKFLDVFLLHCLLQDSPPDSPAEIAAMARNQQATAERGREPGLMLERDGAKVRLTDWAGEIVKAMQPIAKKMDEAFGGTLYADALQAAQLGLDDANTLPSARVLDSIVHDFGGSFTAFVRAQSERTHADMLLGAVDAEFQARLQAQSITSLQEQQTIEAADTMPFDVYLKEYLSPQRLKAKAVVAA